MLRWLLILTMTLLPWHGSAGASLSRAAQPGGHEIVFAGAAHEHAAAADHGTREAQASADCSHDAQPPSGHHGTTAGHEGCAGCSMGHSCSPLGLPAMAALAPAGSVTPQRPVAAVSRFASADRVAGLKPPIS